MQNRGRGFAEHLSGRPWSVIENAHNLNRIVYFEQILHTHTFQQYLGTGVQNGDKASPSISRTSRGQ